MFKEDDSPMLSAMSDILTTYTLYNMDLGIFWLARQTWRALHLCVEYVQGMSDLASVILCIVKQRFRAFWVFAGLLERVVRFCDALCLFAFSP
jgi:hypothetical protein